LRQRLRQLVQSDAKVEEELAELLKILIEDPRKIKRDFRYLLGQPRCGMLALASY
jgi:hypothetical protein